MADHDDPTALVLEAQPLIALHLEDLLREAGFANVSMFSSCSAATAWLEGNTPQLAIIETRLRDGPADNVAAALAKKGVPYIVHSGDDDRRGEHPLMDGRSRWITKPCDPHAFLEAVQACRPLRSRAS